MTIRQAQQRAVLAVLLLESGRLVTFDRLVYEVWGDRPPPTAMNTMHAYVMRLRRVLGDSHRRELTTRAPGYQLDIQHGDLDVSVFERLVSQGQEGLAAGQWEVAAQQLHQALALWHGQAMANVARTPTVAVEADRLEQHRLSAWEAYIDAELELGRHGHVVMDVGRLVAEHPLRERLRGQLMLTLYRCGRRVDALDAYQQGRRLLTDELGIEPAPSIEALQQAILNDDADLPAGVVARILDRTREPAPRTGRPTGSPTALTVATNQPDLSPGGPETSAGARSAAPPAGMLPADIGDFTGREAQVSMLAAHLTRREAVTAVAVCALSGQGGVGKSALAVHVAHRLRGEFADGQLYVDLHGTACRPTDPGEVLARFLTALGVGVEVMPAGLDERAERFRALLADRRMLVVLDNAAGEAQIRPLLPGSPSCAVLTTSRRRLGWLSSQATQLDVLDEAVARELLARIVGADRVASEPDAAGAIVRLCGYLPLAIRIIGTRLAARPHWTCGRMAGRLGDEQQRLDQLWIDDDLAVRTSLELSYRSLEPETRRVFRSLGLLDAPDFAAWVPATMLDIPIELAEDHLDALIDAQLLGWVQPTGETLRYRLNDLVLLYARERAEREDTADWRARARAAWLGRTWAMAAG